MMVELTTSGKNNWLVAKACADLDIYTEERRDGDNVTHFLDVSTIGSGKDIDAALDLISEVRV